MHEVAMMQGAVATITETLERAQAARVTHVALTLGASGHLTEAAARQYFELFTRDTPIADAELEITWLPATYQCFACLSQFTSLAPAEQVVCPTCGAVALEVAHQDVCFVRAIEVEELAEVADPVCATQTTPRAHNEAPPGSVRDARGKQEASGSACA